MDLTRTHQMRPPGETRWYAPARDITVFVPAAIRMALEEWENPDGVYSSMGEGVRRYSEKEVMQVCEALAAFCSEDCIIGPENYMEALEKSGLDRTPMHLRMIVMSLLGEQVLSAFWFGIRGATTKSAKEEKFTILQYDPEVLCKAAQQICKLLRMPPWKRRLALWWDSLRRRLVRVLRDSP